MRSGTPALRPDPVTNPRPDYTPARQASAPGPQAWDAAAGPAFREQPQPSSSAQAPAKGSNTSAFAKPQQGPVAEVGAALPRLATAPPSTRAVAETKPAPSEPRAEKLPQQRSETPGVAPAHPSDAPGNHLPFTGQQDFL